MRVLFYALSFLLAAGVAPGCTRRRDACSEPYLSCEHGETCGDGDTCTSLTWAHGDGAACLHTCASQLDCPRTNGREGRCLDVNRSGAFHCYAACGSGDDCPSEWVCQPIASTRGPGAVCLP